MVKKGSVIVSKEDIEEKVHMNKTGESIVKYQSQNIYLSAFLISQDNFKLGKVYIKDINKDNKAEIEIEYDEKYKNLLDNYIEVFEKNKAIVNLYNYQQNIRFIMHLVNKRKSGIID